MEDKTNEARMVKAEVKKTERRIKEKEEEEKENLIKIRMLEEMISRRFHKYLRVFEKKDSERMLIRKP